MLFPNTTNLSNRYSVMKLRNMFRIVTRYSFQSRSSASQFPKMVESGVNTA